jgi:plasmid maintenance system antidote protein VapI
MHTEIRNDKNTGAPAREEYLRPLGMSAGSLAKTCNFRARASSAWPLSRSASADTALRLAKLEQPSQRHIPAGSQT